VDMKREMARSLVHRSSFAGKRVTVAGLGRFGGGIAVTRWLCAQGAKVLVTDLDSALKFWRFDPATGGIAG
jgi:S-adenosylhomocysteine hydrolase